jgi:hypothetical protein
MDRAALLDLLWEDSPLFVTREAFEKGLEGWDLHDLHGPTGVAIIFVVKGPEFHFCKCDPAYQVTREDLRQWPGSLIERYGYAETRTPKDDTRQQRFNQRLGFVQVGEDEQHVHYRITRMRARN